MSLANWLLIFAGIGFAVSLGAGLTSLQTVGLTHTIAKICMYGGLVTFIACMIFGPLSDRPPPPKTRRRK